MGVSEEAAKPSTVRPVHSLMNASVPPLRHQPLKSDPTGGAKQIRSDLAALERVEGAELDLVVMLAGMQRIEVGNAVHAKDHRSPVGAGFFVPDMLVFPTALERAVPEMRGFREISLCAY